MGNKKGHHDAQSLPEMLDSMSEAKEQALSPRRGQSIYKHKRYIFIGVRCCSVAFPGIC